MESKQINTVEGNNLLSSITGGFLLGAVGGSGIELVKGFKASNGSSNRLMSGFQNMSKNFPPRLATTFAAWNALYVLSDNTLSSFQPKKQVYIPWISCGVASGLVSLPKGVVRASKMAVLGFTVFPMVSLVQFGYKSFSGSDDV